MSTAADYVSSAQALVATIVAAIVDPADAIATLQSLAGYLPTGPTSTAPIGVAMATMQSASGDALRRAALVGMARVSAAYQPTSYNDAAAMRTLLCGLLDAEILLAADQGEDQVYMMLRAVRAAVATDLTARGGSLAQVTAVTVAQPLPSLVLAQRLYQDADRADELVTEANPQHPAFMPISFQALAT